MLKWLYIFTAKELMLNNYMPQTGWSKIYSEYFSHKSWRFIDEGISRAFKKFIKQNTFPNKTVLDLGCGQGQFLQYLEGLGFKGFGVDISEQAISEAKKNLTNSELKAADIFSFEIPQNRFDLIISVASVQHATKPNIKILLDKVYEGLVPGGLVYLDFPSKNTWATFKKYTEVSPGTVIPLEGPELGIPHSFYSKDELIKLFSNYKNLSITEDNGRTWVVTGRK